MDTVYEDTDILVINKPVGLVIDRETLQTENCLVVHRLDKDTSGLLIFAKTPEALEKLQKQFKERKVRKGYLALVHGRLTHPSGVIEAPVGRNPKDSKKFAIVSGGRDAVTRYRVIKHLTASGLPRSARDPDHSEFFKDDPSRFAPADRSAVCSFLEVEPLTGRTHQIRVHLKSIGHPVVGDRLYSSRRQFKESEKLGLTRQFLHAYRLGFSHPRTGEWLFFEVDLPRDLEEVLSEFKI